MPAEMAAAHSREFAKQFVNQFQLESDGSAWRSCQFASPGIDCREIGLFHTTFATNDAELRAIFARIAQGDLFELAVADVPGDVPPRSILINRGDTTRAFSERPGEPFPEELLPIAAGLERFEQRMTGFAVAALGISLGVSPGVARRGDELEIRIGFANRGRAALRALRPGFSDDGARAELTLDLWRVTGPAESDAELELTLDAADQELLIAPRRALPNDQRDLTLGPGEVIETYFRWRLPTAEIGSYVWIAQYRSVAIDDTDSPGLLTGCLISEPAGFRVEMRD